MINPTITTALYRALTDETSTFAEALGVDVASLPLADYDAELSAVFDAGSWLDLAFDAGPTSAAYNQIVFGSGSNTFTIALSGLSPSTTPEQLQAVIASPTGAEYISGFTLIDAGVTILSASVGPSTTTVTSGTQSATFTGSLTGYPSDAIDVLTYLPGIFNELFTGFGDSLGDGGDMGGAGGGDGGDPEPTLADMLGYMGDAGFSSLTYTDDGVDLGEISVSTTELRFSYLGAAFTVTGDFAAGDVPTLLRLLGGAIETDFSDLANLPGCTMTGMTMTDSEGSPVFSFSGSFSGSGVGFAGGTLTVNGTTGDDTGLYDIAEAIASGSLDEGEFAQVNLMLGNGQDQAEADLFRRAYQSEIYGTVIPDLYIHGGGHADTLEIWDIEDEGVYYDRTLAIDWTTGTFDLQAAFDPLDPRTTVDTGVTFWSIDRILLNTYGDVDVTGNQYNNVLVFGDFDGDFSFDGAGGTDTLDLSDFIGAGDDGPGAPAFDSDMIFSDFKTLAYAVITGDGDLAFYDKTDRTQFGALWDVETVVFDDGTGTGTESFAAGRLVDTRLMANLDGTLGGDFLIRQTTHVGGHYIGSGLDGAQGDFLQRAAEKAVATEDFNGDGIADILFEHLSTARKTIVDGDTGAVLNIGRVYQTFLTTLDVDGDGTHEMLFRKSNGDLELASVERYYTYEARYARPTDTLLGVGDFDGDGDDDIALLQSNNNAIWIDTDDGRVIDFGRGVNPTVIGIGDTNGDGVDELIFQRGNGSKFSADKDGIVTEFDLASWTLVGVGDLNGDGADDLLLKKGTTYSAINGETKAVIQQFTETATFLGLANLGFDMTDEILFGHSTLGLKVRTAGVGGAEAFGWSGDSIYLDTATGLTGFDYELI